MEQNLNSMDRWFRVFLAIVLGVASTYVTGIWNVLFVVFAVICIFEALVSYCPIYKMCCGKKK